MKKIILVITCLLMALFLLPGGMASWEEILSIEGAVEVREVIKEYELSIAISGEGETSPPAGKHKFEQGEEVQVKAVPAEGWEFEYWEITGGENVSSSIIFVQMENDLAITAVFSELIDIDDEEEIAEEAETTTESDEDESDDDAENEEKSDSGKPKEDESSPDDTNDNGDTDDNGKDPETEDTSGNDKPEEQVEKEKTPDSNDIENDNNGKKEAKD